MDLRVCTFEHQGALSPGLLARDRVFPLREGYTALDGTPAAPATLLDALREFSRHLAFLELLAERIEAGERSLLRASMPSSEVRLKAPLIYPGKIFCAGANYYDHAREMGDPNWDKVDAQAEPYFFAKPADNTVIGTGEPVEIPRNSGALDWEVELAVVIGRKCKRISPEQAADHVAGYTVFVDMSARDLSRRPTHIFRNDWVSGKCFDGASPMGPCILLKRPGEPFRVFALRLYVNGQIKQDSSTAQMIVGIDRQVSWLSQAITLNPGDVIATGTPAGVGFPRKEFLRPGDVVRAEIDGIGVLVNRIIAPGAST